MQEDDFISNTSDTLKELQGEIAEAKELPLPEIDRIEYDLKDELIRQTIMDTQEDVDKILEEIEKIDERLYEIQKNN